MKKKYMTKRRVNAIVASALAVTLAIPSSAFLGNANAAFAEEEDAIELPEPIAVYDFERGYRGAGYDAEGKELSVTADKSETIWQYKNSENVSGASVVVYKEDGKTAETAEVSNQPYINDDEVRGNVFTLQDTKNTEAAYVKEIVGYAETATYDASGNAIISTGDAIDAEGKKVEKTDKTVTTAHSGATIKNPFAAYRDELVQDVTFDKDGVPDWAGNGVTISYWVKTPKAASGTSVAADSNILSFETTEIDDVFNKDDAVKYEVAKMWRENPNDPIFSTGEAIASVDVEYAINITPIWDSEYDGCLSEDSLTNDTGSDNKKRQGWEYTIEVISKTANPSSFDVSAITEFVVEGNSNNDIILRGENQNSSIVSGEGVYASNKEYLIGKANGKVEFVIKNDEDASGAAAMVAAKTGKKAGSYFKWYRGSWGGTSVATLADIFKYMSVGDEVLTQQGVVYVMTKADKVNGKDVAFRATQKNQAKFIKSTKIVENYGKYAIFNPNYEESYYVDGTSLSKLNGYGGQNGLLKTYETSGSGVEVTDASGNSIMVPRYSFDLGSCQSDLKYVKDANDTCALLFNTSGSWLFKENTEKYTVQTGNSGNGKYRNQSFNTNDANNAQATAYDAQGNVAAESILNAPEEWHFVTYVIQNDKINTYYDGELMDSELYHDYSGAAGKVNVSNQFNLGSGYRDYNSGVLSIFANSHVNAYGCGIYGTEDKDTLGLSSYTMGMTVMELLTREDTVLRLGGQTVTATRTDDTYHMAAGTAAGTSIDDLKFYVEPMDEDMVAELYKQESTAVAKEVKPVASYSFASGTAVTGAASNGGQGVKAPAIVEDASKGSVVKLNAGKAQATSSVVLDNPFKGDRELTGVSVAYWVKQETDKTIKTTPTVAFYNATEEKLEGDSGKLGVASGSVKGHSILYTGTAGDAIFTEGYNRKVGNDNLKNNFIYTTTADAVLADATEWNYMTMTVTNKGVKIYKNGELLENTYPENPGNRFYDGYFCVQRDLDPASSIEPDVKNGMVMDKTVFGGTNNMGSLSLLSFITRDTTDIYLGFAIQKGGEEQDLFEATQTLYMDDVDLYDVALTDAQVKDIYNTAVENFGKDVIVDDGNNGGDDGNNGGDDGNNGGDDGNNEDANFMLGDVTGDTKINSDDAVEILKAFAGLTTLEGDKAKAADVNKDEKINSDDAVEILKFFAGLDSVLTQK